MTGEILRTGCAPTQICAARGWVATAVTVPQQRLYLMPDPHQHGSVRPGGQGRISSTQFRRRSDLSNREARPDAARRKRATPGCADRPGRFDAFASPAAQSRLEAAAVLSVRGLSPEFLQLLPALLRLLVVGGGKPPDRAAHIGDGRADGLVALPQDVSGVVDPGLDASRSAGSTSLRLVRDHRLGNTPVSGILRRFCELLPQLPQRAMSEGSGSREHPRLVEEGEKAGYAVGAVGYHLLVGSSLRGA